MGRPVVMSPMRFAFPAGQSRRCRPWADSQHSSAWPLSWPPFCQMPESSPFSDLGVGFHTCLVCAAAVSALAPSSSRILVRSPSVSNGLGHDGREVGVGLELFQPAPVTSQQQDWDVPWGTLLEAADAPGDLQAVRVDDNNVEDTVPDPFDGNVRVCRCLDLEALAFQDRTEQSENARIIVNYENLHERFSFLGSWSWARCPGCST